MPIVYALAAVLPPIDRIIILAYGLSHCLQAVEILSVRIDIGTAKNWDARQVAILVEPIDLFPRQPTGILYAHRVVTKIPHAGELLLNGLCHYLYL